MSRKAPDTIPKKGCFRCVAIIGPTASGKTELVRRLAHRLPVEVISCDSMQVYRCMPVLTQVPTPAEREVVSYHLTEILSPGQEFNAARFRERTLKLIQDITRRGRLPLIVGGTGFYLGALLDGLLEGPAGQAGVRKKLEAQARKSGSPELHRKLEKVDVEAARTIHPNDLKRIIRALEVIEVTGKKFSLLKKNRRGIWGDYDVRIWGLAWPREVLYDRINRRTGRMIRSGLVEEARCILKRRISKTARGCLGIREVEEYLRGRITKSQMQELLAMNTRRFAKRQLSWFRRDPRIVWINMEKTITIAKAAELIAGELREWKTPY